jgi:hypothetical protein
LPNHIGSSVRTGRPPGRVSSPGGPNRILFAAPIWGILLTILSLTATACLGGKNVLPKVSGVLDPRIVAEFEVQGWAWTDDPENVISPDGKHVLAVLNNEERKALAVIPVEGESHDAKILHEAPAGWVEGDGLDYRTLGWTRDGVPLFVVSGYQNRGPNAGKRGVAIWSGGAPEGIAEELTFIDLPAGDLHTSVYLPEEDKVFISVSAAIYSYDLAGNRVTPVKTGLPTYDDLFYARLSPDGRHFVYELFEEGKSGVYILDAVSGKEEALLATGPTFSFVPQWSPDGKYVAVYTSDRKAGIDGTSAEDYDCFLGTAGPLTIAPAITIVDTSGKVVQTVRVEGKYLANMKWSLDSKSIAFVTGDRAAAEENRYAEMGIPNVQWDGVWTHKIGEGSVPLRIAILTPPAGEGPSFAYPCDFDAAGEGVFYQYGDMENISVWYGGPGKGASTETPLPPVKIADGYWHPQYSNPQFGEYLAALISGDETTELWLLGPKMRKVDYWSSMFTTGLLGFNEDTILLFHREGDGPAKVLVFSVYE